MVWKLRFCGDFAYDVSSLNGYLNSASPHYVNLQAFDEALHQRLRLHIGGHSRAVIDRLGFLSAPAMALGERPVRPRFVSRPPEGSGDGPSIISMFSSTSVFGAASTRSRPRVVQSPFLGGGLSVADSCHLLCSCVQF